MFKIPPVMAAVLFLLPLLAGPVYAGEPHACDFLTVQEVTQVMGYKASDPESKPTNPLGQSICFFDAPAEAGLSFAQLQLVTSSSPKLKKMGLTAAALFTSNTGFIDGPQKITGLGENALWGGPWMKMGAGLHVLHKDVYFVVMAKTDTEEASLAKSRELAQIIISKIK